MMTARLLKFSFVVLLSLAGGSNARAVVLDWDTAAWTNGQLTNSYDIDPDNAGNDVTVSVSGNTAQLGTEPTGQKTPAVTTNLSGGLSPRQNTLTIFLDLTSGSQAVTITVNFSALYTQGVENVSFMLFDVDFANEGGNGADFRDQIRSITGTALDGSLVAPMITTSASNTLSGSGFTQVVDGIATVSDTGTGAGAGNVMISFGTTAITSFTFTYGSGATQKSDPTGQHMGLHDITFTPVPEINPAFSAIGSCLMAVGLVFHHRSRVRARRK
jgi:hypothetical protein